MSDEELVVDLRGAPGGWVITRADDADAPEDFVVGPGGARLLLLPSAAAGETDARELDPHLAAGHRTRHLSEGAGAAASASRVAGPSVPVGAADVEREEVAMTQAKQPLTDRQRAQRERIRRKSAALLVKLDEQRGRKPDPAVLRDARGV